MMAFIGLGNGGSVYANTKHNFGFWVVDELARRWKLFFKPGKGDYVFAMDQSKNILLAKPTCGMNLSGIAVKQILNQWDIELPKLHVIVDDVDLPLETLRIRPWGGDGCHLGMKSVIQHADSIAFPRIRIGIATEEKLRPAEDYVLKPFGKKYSQQVKQMIQLGADAAESIIETGIQKAMSKFNKMTTPKDKLIQHE